MAAIARTPLNDAAGSPWDALARQVRSWLAEQEIEARDAVLLLPFAQQLPLARQAFAQLGGWQPRVETTHTLAAALGPAATPQPMQLSSDPATDRLVAARLLRDQATGAAWARRDPRRFERAVQALVQTAQELSQAAHAVPPSRRQRYWDEARARLGPLPGPGAAQRWLARVALEWAAQGPPPRTDRLFDLRPAAWIALQVGGSDALTEALLAEAGCPVLVIDADAAPALPVQAPILLRCEGFEDEAQAAAAQLLAHLRAGRWPVALAGQDRQLVRRVRALLERQQVPLADETGWALSTTRAAATLMALLRAAAPRASVDLLLDALKALPPWPGLARSEVRLASLERHCRRHAVSRVERLREAALDDELAEFVVAVDDVLSLLRGPRRSVADWLQSLREVLQRCGAWDALAADEAGQGVLQSLRLGAESDGGEAWRDAATQAVLGLDGFTAWVDAVLESASFTPAAPPAEQQRVVVTPLARTLMRPFAALVCPGSDDRHLGAAPASHPLLSEAELVALGVAGRAERQRREALAFSHAAALPHATFLRRQADANGEPLSDSPLLQRLALDLAATGRSLHEGRDAREAQVLAFRPLARPRPVASALLPERVSASAVEALRDCPYRFFARHLLGLREDDELEAELEKRDYGEWLHRVLLEFHRGRAEGSSEQDDASRLRDIGERVRIAQGLGDEEFLPFAASFEALVPRYLAWQRERDRQGVRWVDGELERRIRPEALGGIELQGVIDRIDRAAPDGALELIDYKTSSVQRLREKLREPLEDTQLAFYAALLAPQATALSACYLPLDSADEMRPLPHPQVQRSADVLVRELGAEFARVRAGAPLPALGEGEVCETCEARGLCRRDHWPEAGEP